MKVDEITYNNSLANDETAIGVSVTITRGEQTFDAYFIAGDVVEEFGRVAGTMLSAMSLLQNEDGTKAVNVDDINNLKKTWRGLVHG